MTPENIKSLPVQKASLANDDVIDMLESWLDQAKKSEIISVGIVGFRVGKEWQTQFSSSQDALRDAAMLMELAIRRMGFVQR